MKYHLCPTSPPGCPVNATYTLLILLLLFSISLSYRDYRYSKLQKLCSVPLFRSFQRNYPSPRPCVLFHNVLFSKPLQPKSHTGIPSLASCLHLLIQHIYSYPPPGGLLLYLQPEDVLWCSDKRPT
jgi:hypothetical protein